MKVLCSSLEEVGKECVCMEIWRREKMKKKKGIEVGMFWSKEMVVSW